jgi:hypothetical protein
MDTYSWVVYGLVWHSKNLNILNWIVKINENLYVILMTIESSLWPLKVYPHEMEKFEFANHLTLIACFVSYKKWMQREQHLFKTHEPDTNFDIHC